MSWPLVVTLDRKSKVALFSQLSSAVSDAVQQGRLRPGTALPGTRTLAAALDVHRNTVVAAYRELEAQGWIETAGQRTCVAERLPSRRPSAEPTGLAAVTAFRVGRVKNRRSGHPEARFDLGGGLPDPRLAPSRVLARAVGRVLRNPRSRTLEYGDPQGHPRLRAEVAKMLAHTRGLPIGADDVLITRGSQMALALIARVLIAPGDTIAVERWGYAPAWDAFEHAGATLHGVEIDEHGIDVDGLESLTPRAVYVTPQHQYPTMVSLDASRRLRLLDWAARNRVAVIEDDYDNEYHYDGQPLHPLAALDRRGSVIYVGTLSKVLAPGLRIGWVVAPSNLIEAMVRLRRAFDGQGGLPIEAAVAELLEDREVQRHIWRTRRLYAERRDALAAALRERLGDVLTFDVPSGGLALWARIEGGPRADAWAERALRRGVRVTTGRRYSLARRASQHLRLGFARHTPEELHQAATILSTTLSATTGR